MSDSYASFSAVAALTLRLPQFQYSTLIFDLKSLSVFSCFLLAPALLPLSLPPPLFPLLFFFCFLSWSGSDLKQGARTPSLPREPLRFEFEFEIIMNGLQGSWEINGQTGRAQIPEKRLVLGAASHAYSKRLLLAPANHTAHRHVESIPWAWAVVHMMCVRPCKKNTAACSDNHIQ